MRAAEQNEQVHAAHLIATTQHPHGCAHRTGGKSAWGSKSTKGSGARQELLNGRTPVAP